MHVSSVRLLSCENHNTMSAKEDENVPHSDMKAFFSNLICNAETCCSGVIPLVVSF